jgi:hypothetical protein
VSLSICLDTDTILQGPLYILALNKIDDTPFPMEFVLTSLLFSLLAFAIIVAYTTLGLFRMVRRLFSGREATALQ